MGRPKGSKNKPKNTPVKNKPKTSGNMIDKLPDPMLWQGARVSIYLPTAKPNEHKEIVYKKVREGENVSWVEMTPAELKEK